MPLCRHFPVPSIPYHPDWEEHPAPQFLRKAMKKDRYCGLFTHKPNILTSQLLLVAVTVAPDICWELSKSHVFL